MIMLIMQTCDDLTLYGCTFVTKFRVHWIRLDLGIND